MSELTTRRDLSLFSCSISPLPNGEWECKLRGVPIVGYAPTATDAACRRFTRVVDGRKPKLLDLFCGAGGAGMGYHRAGFEVTGVDINPQPRYPFTFIQGDALEYLAKHGHEYDVIHASPPCQFAAQMFCPTKPEARQKHQNFIPQTRALLQQLGKPYVIENVKGARKHLINPLMLHGSMFGLPIFRDRYFEMSHPIYFTPTPRRDFTPVPINSSSKEGNKHASVAVMKSAMGIDWMTKAELREAIPPAYTEWIGKQLMNVAAYAGLKVSA